MRKKIIKIIKGIIFIGFSVQIALGLVWMGCNFAHVQDFEGASTGIYAGAVRLLGRAYPVMYVLQLLAAGFAGQRLVLRLCGRGPNRNKNRLSALWGSLALMTLPMAMQCHMALLPYSFVCSAGLLQLSFCCELLDPVENSRHSRLFGHMDYFEHSGTLGHREVFDLVPFAGIWICYLVQALLLPEYIFLGAVPVAVMLFLKRKGIAGAKIRLKILLFGLVIAAAAAGICAISAGSAKAQAENDISGIEWFLMKRLCWPTLWVDHEGMPDEIGEAIASVVWESAYYPGNMDRIFKPAIEAAMSAEEAKPLLAEAAVGSWDIHYSMIIRQIGWDVLGYGISPVILRQQLSGDAYESHSGRNYAIMRQYAPVLTRLYVNYCSWWFAAAAGLTMLLLVFRLAAGESPYRWREGRLFAVVFLTAVCCICWYTFQGAGIMDYKYTVFINELWFLWSFKTMEDKNPDEGESKRT